MLNEVSKAFAYGIRFARLGTASDLVIAAPLEDGSSDETAHTAAGRIGLYFDRTVSSEKIGFVVLGTEALSVFDVGVVSGGYIRPGSTTEQTPGNLRYSSFNDDLEAFLRSEWRSLTKPSAAGPGGDLEVFDIGEGGPYDSDGEGNIIVEYWLYDASAASGSRFTRATSNAGTQLLGDGDAIVVGSPFNWSAVVFDLTTVPVGAVLAVDYWDGAAWVETTYATYLDDGSSLTPLAANPPNGTGTVSIEHADGIDGDWVAADNVLDEVPDWDGGDPLYPVRIRNVGTVTTGMAFEAGKVRGTDLSVDPATGDATLWGRARGKTSVVREAGRFTSPPASLAPGDADVDLGPNSTLRGSINLFPGNKLAELLFVTVIPPSADTATNAVIRWAGKVSSGAAGNIELEATLVPFDEGDIADGTLPELPASSTVFAAPGTADEIVIAEIPLDVSSLTPDSKIALRFFRDASGGNADDTYGDDWIMIDLELTFSRKFL